MCKSEIHNMDPSLLAPLILFLNQYFNTYFPESWLLILAAVNFSALVSSPPQLVPTVTAAILFLNECGLGH
jgi:hypothetical protein